MKAKKLLPVVLLLGVLLAMTLFAVTASAATTSVGTEGELKAAVEAGGEIQLTADIDLTAVLRISTTVKLDLAGHSITQTYTYEREWCADCQDWKDWCEDSSHTNTEIRDCGVNAIYLFSGANLTVDDSVGGGKIIGTWHALSNDSVEDIVLTVNAGNIVGTYSAVWNSWEEPRANIVINGGTFDGEAYPTSVTDGTFNGYSEVYGDITGGTFNEYVYVTGAVSDGVFNGTAQVYGDITGGTFGGTTYAYGSITGGTFNNLKLYSGATAANCTVNGALDWSGSVPDVSGITFGESATVAVAGYKLVDGAIVEKVKYNVIVASADTAKGTVKVSSYKVGGGSGSGGFTSLEKQGYEGTAASFKAVATANENYTFIGWYDAAESGALLTTDAEVNYAVDALAEDVVYYAVFALSSDYQALLDETDAWIADYDTQSVFEITFLRDMEKLQAAVNVRGKNFAGKTVSLTTDLTYTATDVFTPVGTSDTPFKGTFDGASHTVHGLHFETTSNSANGGMFAYTSGATIRDLTLCDVNFSGGSMTGAFAGDALRTRFENCKLTACEGKTSALSYGMFLGGIFGHSFGGNTVVGCTVEKTTLTGSWKTGGITGYADGVTVSDTVVRNVTVSGSGVIGAMIGHANAGATNLTDIVVADVVDGEAAPLYLVATNYASGKNNTVTVSGDATNVVVADVLGDVTSTDELSVTGGTYTTVDTNGNTVKLDVGAYIPANAVQTEDGTVATISGVARIGTQGYETLAEAVAAATAGDTITLLGDVTQDDGIIVNKSLTLDLGGFTFTVNTGASANSRNIKVTGTADFTVKNGTMIAGGTCLSADHSATGASAGSGCYGTMRFESTGKLTMTDLTLENSRPWGMNIKLLAGTAELTNVIVNSTCGGCLEVAGATATVTDCTMTQQNYHDHCSSCISVSSESSAGSVTVNGGSYTSVVGTALYVFSSGGTLTVNGGTFKGGKNVLKADLDSGSYPDGQVTVELKDGTYTGSFAEGGSGTKTIAISGGTYSVAVPEAYCAEGYEPVDNGDGTYSVAKAEVNRFGKALVIVNKPTTEYGSGTYYPIDVYCGIDALQYKEVGVEYRLVVTGANAAEVSGTKSTTVVYTKMNVTTTSSETKVYTPTDLNATYMYGQQFLFDTTKYTSSAVTLYVKPYAVSLDGSTTYYGDEITLSEDVCAANGTHLFKDGQ